LSGKRLSGKRLVRETSVRESDCPGKVRYPVIIRIRCAFIIESYSRGRHYKFIDDDDYDDDEEEASTPSYAID